MTTDDAIRILRQFNAWRRDDDGALDQPSPREIGEAIDLLCDHAERLDHELQDRAESWRMSSVCRAKEAVIARLELELEQERQNRKQSDLDTIRALGERNDARAEIERRANAKAIHAMTPQERFALMFQQKPTDD